MDWRRTERRVVEVLFTAMALATAVSAVEAIGHAITDPSARKWSLVGYWLLRTAVVTAIAAFVFARQPARRRSREPVAFLACAVAIVSLLALEQPADGAGTGLVAAGELVALVSCAWLLASVLTLGRCFGVLPEARGLVTRGPYRVVRHPMYVGELGLCLGLVIAAPSAWNAGVFAVFALAQATRMRLEERALTNEFPEYARYATSTARFIPHTLRLSRPAGGSRHEPSNA